MITLHTASDYEKALKRLDEVFDAPIGTPEAAERHGLLEQIERYEESHHEPIPPPSAAELLEFYRDQGMGSGTNSPDGSGGDV